MAKISVANMFCHQSFDCHVPFSVASIFNHYTMTNNQTLVMDNKGFTSFHHVFFWLGKIVFEVELNQFSNIFATL
jgi:hypothetical protein